MNCNLARHSERRSCCARCFRAFSSQVVFDWHQRGGKCSDPTDGGFVARTIPGKVGDVQVWGMAGSWAGPDDD